MVEEKQQLVFLDILPNGDCVNLTYVRYLNQSRYLNKYLYTDYIIIALLPVIQVCKVMQKLNFPQTMPSGLLTIFHALSLKPRYVQVSKIVVGIDISTLHTATFTVYSLRTAIVAFELPRNIFTIYNIPKLFPKQSNEYKVTWVHTVDLYQTK